MIRYLLAISFLFSITTAAAENTKTAKAKRSVATVSINPKDCVADGPMIEANGVLTWSCKATGKSGYNVFFSQCSDFNNHRGEMEAVSGGCRLLNDDGGKSKARLVGSFSGVTIDRPGWACQYADLSPEDVIAVTVNCK